MADLDVATLTLEERVAGLAGLLADALNALNDELGSETGTEPSEYTEIEERVYRLFPGEARDRIVHGLDGKSECHGCGNWFPYQEGFIRCGSCLQDGRSEVGDG